MTTGYQNLPSDLINRIAYELNYRDLQSLFTVGKLFTALSSDINFWHQGIWKIRPTCMAIHNHHYLRNLYKKLTEIRDISQVEIRGEIKNFEMSDVSVYLNFNSIMQVAEGGNCLAILTTGGQLYTVGNNYRGQLGLGDSVSRTEPTLVEGFDNIIQVACGSYHTLFLTDDGRVYGFGVGKYLGLDNDQLQLVPRQIFPLSNIIQIACGDTYTLMVSDQGKLYQFGKICSDSDWWSVPQEMTNPEGQPFDNIVDIACGDEHACILERSSITGKSTIYTLGSNNYYQLGLPDPTTNSVPIRLSGYDNVKQISCGKVHTALLTEAGTVHIFGCNFRSQLGIIYNSLFDSDKNLPFIVPNITNAVQLTCGWYGTGIVCKSPHSTQYEIHLFGDNSEDDKQKYTHLIRDSKVTLKCNTFFCTITSYKNT